MSEVKSPLVPFTKEEIDHFKERKNVPSKEKVSDHVNELRKWLVQQRHLPKLDEEILRKYLFGCKYDLEETKLRVNNYYAFRARNPKLFADRDPCSSEQRDRKKVIHLATLPKATKEGYRVHVGLLSDPDPEFYNAVSITKHSQAICDLVLRDEGEVCSPGLIIVISGAGVTMKHVVKWELSLLKAISEMITKSRPESIKGVHFIDCTNAIKPVVLLLTSLLSSKLKKRISYNDPEVLYAQVPKELLPDEFGGTAGATAKYAELWNEYVEKNRDWLMNEGTMKSDLDLMPKDNEHCVFQETFRKLDLD